MFWLLVDEQAGEEIQCGQAFDVRRFFEHVHAAVEILKQVVSASGKESHAVRDERKLRYGVPPTTPGSGGETAHRQGEG